MILVCSKHRRSESTPHSKRVRVRAQSAAASEASQSRRVASEATYSYVGQQTWDQFGLLLQDAGKGSAVSGMAGSPIFSLELSQHPSQLLRQLSSLGADEPFLPTVGGDFSDSHRRLLLLSVPQTDFEAQVSLMLVSLVLILIGWATVLPAVSSFFRKSQRPHYQGYRCNPAAAPRLL